MPVSNTIAVTNKVLRETLAEIITMSVAVKNIDGSYSDKFSPADQGSTVRIRRPNLGTIQTNNMAYVHANAAVSEGTVELAVSNSFTMPIALNDADLLLKVEDFRSRFAKSFGAQIAANVDYAVHETIGNCAVGIATAGTETGGFTNGNAGAAQAVNTGGRWLIGTDAQVGAALGGGATALNTALLMKAKSILDQAGAPQSDRVGLLSPDHSYQIAASQVSGMIFAPAIIESIYEEGAIGKFAGITWYTSTNSVSHTNGAQTTLAVTANGALSSWAESQVVTVTATTQALKAGDKFTFPGVFHVNDITKKVTSLLQVFTVVKDYNAGATLVEISPAPVTSGPYQNISATLVGKTGALAGAANLVGAQETVVFSKQAIAGAFLKLLVPSGKDMAKTETDPKTGISMRFIRDYDAIGGSGFVGFVNRFDAVYGVKIVRPEWIVSIRA